jgi:hypothetical protein
MAYAAATAAVTADDEDAAVEEASLSGDMSVPDPQLNPLRSTKSALAEPALPTAPHAYTADEVYRRLPAAALTLTKLDTQGLRLWIADQSTREKRYAVFTMPAFAEMPSLLAKPEVTFAARFDQAVYRGMRTDHFAGSTTQPPAVVDLTTYEIIAAR